MPESLSVDYLFPDFLESEEKYEACHRFWVTVAESAIRRSGDLSEWLPFEYASFSEKWWLGNPIVGGARLDLSRGFKIVQMEPNDNSFNAYFEKESEEDPGEVVRNQLVILLSMTRRTLNVASQLLEMWADHKTSLDEIEAYAGTILATWLDR